MITFVVIAVGFIVFLVIALMKSPKHRESPIPENKIPKSQNTGPKIELAELLAAVPEDTGLLSDETIASLTNLIRSIPPKDLELDPILDNKNIREGKVLREWRFSGIPNVDTQISINCLSREGTVTFWFEDGVDLNCNFDFRGIDTVLANGYHRKLKTGKTVEATRAELGAQKNYPTMVKVRSRFSEGIFAETDETRYYDYFLYRDFLFKVDKQIGSISEKAEITQRFYEKEKATGTLWLKSRRELDLEANAIKEEEDAENRRQSIPTVVKNEVWRRDRGRCAICGSQKNLEFDHMIPISKGGSNTARNVQLLCMECNRKKSDKIQ